MSEVIQDIAVENVLKQVVPAVEKLSAVIPDAPSEAGSYVLTATVDAEGAVEYAWVSAE